ncbi:hypothetical protein ElyMa_004033800 [Elysia marginata]|uniref:Uncharacterized protein n=1 Tax=Elysia marginata TaxID=1093978 RepID=A0AAV4G2Y9_9GAST|nr:hypothetical protein ElyMa_004033800 [Elysia marginata]
MRAKCDGDDNDDDDDDDNDDDDNDDDDDDDDDDYDDGDDDDNDDDDDDDDGNDEKKCFFNDDSIDFIKTHLTTETHPSVNFHPTGFFPAPLQVERKFPSVQMVPVFVGSTVRTTSTETCFAPCA